MKTIVLTLLFTSFPFFRIYSQTVTDYDGNEYSTITIGSQTWMAENLRTTHYSDGTPLVNGAGIGEIEDSDTTRYFFYYNDSIVYAESYGCLYTWYAAIRGIQGSETNPSGIQGVCPTDWHIPSKIEWSELIDFVGTNSLNKLIEGGNSGFNAKFVGGWDSNSGTFISLNQMGQYITSGSFSNTGFYFCKFYNGANEVTFHPHTKACGYSVRCVKDESITSIKAIDHNEMIFRITPNPFVQSTNIYIQLPKSEYISLIIFNLTGEYVATLINEVCSAGKHQVQWQANGLPASIYFAQLQCDTSIKTQKLIIQK